MAASMAMPTTPSLQMLRTNVVPSCSKTRLNLGFQTRLHNVHHSLVYREYQRVCASTYDLSQESVKVDVESIGSNAASIEGITVTSTDMEDGKIQMKVDVSGARTEAIFESVFSRMVSAAQPIPGFRRVKGGKTPNIHRDVLIQILGPSKVYKQVIKKIINSTVAEYVEKQKLKVTKDLRVEQSFEELEDTFEPGEEFSFDVTLQLREE